MYVVRMKIEKIGSSDSVSYILVHFFVWNDFCTRAPMTVLRMLNGRVFLGCPAVARAYTVFQFQSCHRIIRWLCNRHSPRQLIQERYLLRPFSSTADEDR